MRFLLNYPLVVPALLVAVTATLLFVAGFKDAAMYTSYIGSVVVFIGGAIYILVIDPLKRLSPQKATQRCNQNPS